MNSHCLEAILNCDWIDQGEAIPGWHAVLWSIGLLLGWCILAPVVVIWAIRTSTHHEGQVAAAGAGFAHLIRVLSRSVLQLRRRMYPVVSSGQHAKLPESLAQKHV